MRVKFISLSSIESVIFNKLDSNTKRQTKIPYKIDSGMDGNLRPFKILKMSILKVHYKGVMCNKIVW